MPRNLNIRGFIAVGLVFAFLGSILQPSYAQKLTLPAPGTMVNLSPAYVPVLIKGLRVHPENPLLFDFILDIGRSGLKINSPEFKDESEKLIKYFLASLTIKEDDLWVNLSPYEKDRIIPKELGQTELGQEMLAQDYILKQLTASLIYPEKQLGREFWNTVYAKAQQEFGTSDIPVNTFNKVWIIADKAKILERNNVGYVVGSHLKVMLEEDYMALKKHTAINLIDGNKAHSVTSQVVREIIIPELEKEVNQGQHFAPLRQMFYSMILASWYKLALKDALLNQVYSNKGKTGGILSDDPTAKENIFQQYLQAYKKGVFNYIKEDMDAVSKQPMPRKYFSGGLKLIANPAQLVVRESELGEGDSAQAVGDEALETVGMSKQVLQNPDAAMRTEDAYDRFSLNRDELLRKPFEVAEKEVKSAYRKLAIKIHPDKLEAEGSLDRQNTEAWNRATKEFSDLSDDFKLVLDDIQRNSGKDNTKTDEQESAFQDFMNAFKEAMAKEAQREKEKRMAEFFKQWEYPAEQHRRSAENESRYYAISEKPSHEDSWLEFIQEELLNRHSMGSSLNFNFRMQIAKDLIVDMDNKGAIKKVLDTAAKKVKENFKYDDFTEDDDITSAENSLKRDVDYFDTYFGLFRGVSAQLDKSVGPMKRFGMSSSAYNFIEMVCKQGLYGTPFAVQSFMDYLAAWGKRGILDVSPQDVTAALEAYRAAYPERLSRNEKNEYIVHWFHIASAREGKSYVEVQAEVSPNPVYILPNGSRIEITKPTDNQYETQVTSNSKYQQNRTVNYTTNEASWITIDDRKLDGIEFKIPGEYKDEKFKIGEYMYNKKAGLAGKVEIKLYKTFSPRLPWIPEEEVLTVVLQDIIDRLLKGNMDKQLFSLNIRGDNLYFDEQGLTIREWLKKIQIQYLPPKKGWGVSLTKPKQDDSAMTVTELSRINDPGGIDFNAKNMSMDVSGQGIDVKFDSAMVAEFRHGNFSGIVANIIRIIPIKNALPMMGLEKSPV